MPSAREMAEQGLELIKKALLVHVRARPEGTSNVDIAGELGLRSDHEGGSKNFLTFSVLGILMREGLIQKKKIGSRTLYIAATLETETHSASAT